MIATSRVTWHRAGAAVLVLVAALVVLLVAVDGGRFPRAPEPTVAPPATLQALLEQGSQERHALYAFLRAEAPGARIIIDTDGSGPNAGFTSLRSLGGVGPIERLALSDGVLGDAWIPTTEPDVRGRLRFDAWELHREPGVLDTVFIGTREGRTVLVDRRSVPELGLPAWEGGTPTPAAPSLARAVTVETVLLLGLLLLGGLVLPRGLGTATSRPALALIAGAAVQALGAYLFLAGVLSMVGGTLVAAGVWWWLRRRGVSAGWSRADLPLLAVSTVALALTALAVRMQGLVIVSADAIAHVERAIAIGAGTMGLADLNEKRPLALAAIQAPAHALGVEGLHVLGWALLIAAAVVLAVLPSRLIRSGTVAAAVTGGALLALVPLVPLVRTMAASLNTHLLVAVLLLLLVALWASDGSTSRVDLVPAAAITLLALVPSRAESVLIVGLVLLATLAVGDDAPAWPWAWPVVGVGLLAWNGLHIIAALDAGVAPSFPVTALTVLGGVTLLLGPAVLRLRPRFRRGLAVAAMAVLWLMLLGLLTSVIGSGAGALQGLRVNLGEGEGAWGVLAPTVVALVALALVAGTARPDRRLVLARWLTVGAVPSVLLAKAADGTDQIAAGGVGNAIDAVLSLGARVGSWGDSSNRMWSHFLLVALALVAVELLRAATREEPDTPGAPDRSARTGATRWPEVGAAVLALAAIVVTLVTWRPTYLGPSSPGSVVGIAGATDPDVAVPEAVPGTELTEGVREEATVTVPPVALPEDARDVTLCATFRFTDLDRIVTGRTLVGLATSEGTVTVEFDEFAWAGERTEVLCLDGPGVDEGPTTLTAWAEGRAGATAGTAAVLLVRPSDGIGPLDTVEVRYVAASEDPRGVLQRLVSSGLRLAIRGGPLAVIVLTVVGLLLLLAPVRAGRQDGVTSGGRVSS